MTELPPDNRQDGKADPKLTAFGEPVWVDTLKTLGVVAVMLLIVIGIGGALGVAIMAPWGRASHDCSIYCVLEQYLDSFFSNDPS